MAQSIAFSDDATLFLNSEQVQEFKKMVVDLENSSEDKIFKVKNISVSAVCVSWYKSVNESAVAFETRSALPRTISWPNDFPLKSTPPSVPISPLKIL